MLSLRALGINNFYSEVQQRLNHFFPLFSTISQMIGIIPHPVNEMAVQKLKKRAIC
jgi:hypothetical protein